MPLTQHMAVSSDGAQTKMTCLVRIDGKPDEKFTGTRLEVLKSLQNNAASPNRITVLMDAKDLDWFAKVKSL